MSYFKRSKMSSSSTIETSAPVGFYVLWFVLIHDQGRSVRMIWSVRTYTSDLRLSSLAPFSDYTFANYPTR